MRFLADEDLHPAVAGIGRRLGLDVVSVHEIDRRGFTDEEQLRFAVAERRIFVTRNRDDFIRLTLTFFQTGEMHHGGELDPAHLAQLGAVDQEGRGKGEESSRNERRRAPVSMLESSPRPPDEVGFNLYRSIGGGAYQLVTTAPSGATSTTNLRLPVGALYRFQVTAFNAAGESQSSTPAILDLRP